MKYFQLMIGAVGALLVFAGAAKAQPDQLPEPLYSESFENGVGTWLGIGAGAKVSTERTPENAEQGAGSLRFDYQVTPGQMNALIAPFGPNSLATLQSISFWVKADHTTSLALTVQEEGGGRFSTVFSVTKGQWQRVEVAPWDLVLQVGKDDPKDGDGKLNLDKIEGIGLFDFTQLIAQMATDPNNPIVKALGVQMGPRTLYVDDFVLSSDPPTPLPGAKVPTDKSLLDDFAHPQVSWAELGDVTFKVLHPFQKKGQPQATIPDNTLQADYTQAPGRIEAFSKFLPDGVLTGKTSLSLSVASRLHTTIIVQVEEKSGGKYNTSFEVPAQVAPPDPGTAPSFQTLAFADFKPADDSKDDNNQLDLDQVKQILIIDASGMLGGGEGENTLWLSQIRVNK